VYTRVLDTLLITTLKIYTTDVLVISFWFGVRARNRVSKVSTFN